MRTKSYARERNAANVEANGHPAAHLHADRGRDHLLLGDEHLEVAVLVRLAEEVRVRRVRHLAVERDHVAAQPAERGERLAVGLARRLLGAEVPGGQLAPGGGEAVRRAGRRGGPTVTAMSRSPPSSAIAASGSSSGLPCLPGWSSTTLTPLPFFVRATMTVGRPVVASASA